MELDMFISIWTSYSLISSLRIVTSMTDPLSSILSPQLIWMLIWMHKTDNLSKDGSIHHAAAQSSTSQNATSISSAQHSPHLGVSSQHQIPQRQLHQFLKTPMPLSQSLLSSNSSNSSLRAMTPLTSVSPRHSNSARKSVVAKMLLSRIVKRSLMTVLMPSLLCLVRMFFRNLV
jgi:hypothetical protein